VTSFATLTIHALLRRESPRLPWGATLVTVTATVTEELATTILHLRDAGRRMALVSLADEDPPELDGVATYHLPPSTPIVQPFSQKHYNVTAALEAPGLLAPDWVCWRADCCSSASPFTRTSTSWMGDG
jgi:hypothetical protein